MFDSRIRTLCVIAGWLTLVLIACITLSPIEDRPSLAGAQLERFVAFAVMGLVFVLGYPRRTLLIVVVVIGSAFMLEAMQLLTPDRHGRLLDAIVKATGGMCGIAAGRITLLSVHRQIARLKSRSEQSASKGRSTINDMTSTALGNPDCSGQVISPTIFARHRAIT